VPVVGRFEISESFEKLVKALENEFKDSAKDVAGSLRGAGGGGGGINWEAEGLELGCVPKSKSWKESETAVVVVVTGSPWLDNCELVFKSKCESSVRFMVVLRELSSKRCN